MRGSEKLDCKLQGARRPGNGDRGGRGKGDKRTDQSDDVEGDDAAIAIAVG